MSSMSSSWWVSGKKGRLPPAEQAKLWAITMMIDKFDFKLPASKIMSVLKKVGGGCPDERSVQRWQEAFRKDPHWHPGKTAEVTAKPGPKKAFTEQKKNAVAKAAEAIKRSGKEPTTALVRLRCPTATFDPKTEEPFTDKYILQVFRERCFDDGADTPWGHLVPYNKMALSDKMKLARFAYSKRQLALESV